MIVQDNPSDELFEQLCNPVLAVRPIDRPNEDRRNKKYAVTETDEKGALTGGIYAFYRSGWAYIDIVWTREDHRGKGLGRRLMEKAEAEALKKGCHSVFLWTQDFEAPGFYEKLGYSRFVVFEDYIPGHQRIGFMKQLADIT